MAPTKIDQGTLIILDIGRNVSKTEGKGEKSFFESARECTARIIERKIISQGKNYLGIILLGSKKSTGDFKYIEVFSELQTPTWQMIRNLPDQPTKAKGNWFDAIIVAANHYMNEVSGVKIMNKKIILMTNFEAASYVDREDIEKVLVGFKESGLEIDVFGPDIYSENNKNEDLELARELVEGTNGTTTTFDFIMKYLLFHKKKVVNPTPWNVDLSIGPNIKIPVSAYIRLKDQPVVKNWLASVRDPVTNTASTTEGIMKNKIFVNSENQSVVEHSEVIKGYCYGQEIIPFSECDKSMLYESGGKSLAVYGFTQEDNITWQCLNGDGLSYVFGQKNDKKAQYAIRCLAECLHELKLVGIVRRVYNNGNAPKMYALMPVIDPNFICLSMVGICFKEDIKSIAFPPLNLKKFATTDEQVDAFKELIKAMDLTKAYDEDEFDDTEAFPIAECVSPSAQYVLDCIAFRAMNPGKPLPPPRDDIMMLFKVPPLIEKRSRDPLEKLKNLFELKKVEVRTRKKQTVPEMDIENVAKSDNNENMDDMPKINLDVYNKPNKVYRVGTIDPIDDFNTLKTEGKPLQELYKEMGEAIENMIFSNFDGNYDNAFKAMLYYRTECVKSDPSYYNNWLREFKMELHDRKKNNILNMFSDRKVDFILKEENDKSTFENADEDSQLYEMETMPTLTEVSISTEVNDMFDEM
ncbi:X-ray repair cross-complementing protein 5-like [Colias croceus]|uniref:X-ray repair cross-complementing protein 5-like n=1 Tax=Colias crocea TaxID=72248 RepID=UPI001E27A4CA|nr:X-ray repair cross-complementing protein 5-like [Colias croceus]